MDFADKRLELHLIYIDMGRGFKVNSLRICHKIMNVELRSM